MKPGRRKVAFLVSDTTKTVVLSLMVLPDLLFSLKHNWNLVIIINQKVGPKTVASRRHLNYKGGQVYLAYISRPEKGKQFWSISLQKKLGSFR